MENTIYSTLESITHMPTLLFDIDEKKKRFKLKYSSLEEMEAVQDLTQREKVLFSILCNLDVENRKRFIANKIKQKRKIYNYTKYDPHSKEFLSKAVVDINMTFEWFSSKEGYDYWSEVLLKDVKPKVMRDIEHEFN